MFPFISLVFVFNPQPPLCFFQSKHTLTHNSLGVIPFMPLRCPSILNPSPGFYKSSFTLTHTIPLNSMLLFKNRSFHATSFLSSPEPLPWKSPRLFKSTSPLNTHFLLNISLFNERSCHVSASLFNPNALP